MAHKETVNEHDARQNTLHLPPHDSLSVWSLQPDAQNNDVSEPPGRHMGQELLINQESAASVSESDETETVLMEEQDWSVPKVTPQDAPRSPRIGVHNKQALSTPHENSSSAPKSPRRRKKRDLSAFSAVEDTDENILNIPFRRGRSASVDCIHTLPDLSVFSAIEEKPDDTAQESQDVVQMPAHITPQMLKVQDQSKQINFIDKVGDATGIKSSAISQGDGSFPRRHMENTLQVPKTRNRRKSLDSVDKLAIDRIAESQTSDQTSLQVPKTRRRSASIDYIDKSSIDKVLNSNKVAQNSLHVPKQRNRRASIDITHQIQARKLATCTEEDELTHTPTPPRKQRPRSASIDVDSLPSRARHRTPSTCSDSEKDRRSRKRRGRSLLEWLKHFKEDHKSDQSTTTNSDTKQDVCQEAQEKDVSPRGFLVVREGPDGFYVVKRDLSREHYAPLESTSNKTTTDLSVQHTSVEHNIVPRTKTIPAIKINDIPIENFGDDLPDVERKHEGIRKRSWTVSGIELPKGNTRVLNNRRGSTEDLYVLKETSQNKQGMGPNKAENLKQDKGLDKQGIECDNAEIDNPYLDSEHHNESQLHNNQNIQHYNQAKWHNNQGNAHQDRGQYNQDIHHSKDKRYTHDTICKDIKEGTGLGKDMAQNDSRQVYVDKGKNNQDKGQHGDITRHDYSDNGENNQDVWSNNEGIGQTDKDPEQNNLDIGHGLIRNGSWRTPHKGHHHSKKKGKFAISYLKFFCFIC